MKTPVLYIVIPCYNEEEMLPITSKALIALTDDMIGKQIIDPKSRIVLVDDGSKDRTWQCISELHKKDKRFEGVKLAHNVGHMNALWAGMTLASEKCDCMISIDADLQDDINAMYGFLEEYGKGADVVTGVRSSRRTDTAFKRSHRSRRRFYWMLSSQKQEFRRSMTAQRSKAMCGTRAAISRRHAPVRRTARRKK